MKELLLRRITLWGLLFMFGGFGALNGSAALINWTNTAGGDWFNRTNWSPNAVPAATDAAFITNNGTYTVLIATGTVATATITIGGASGTQTVIYGSTAAFTRLALTNSVVQANGILVVTNAGMYGTLTVKPGGELQLNSAGMQLYNFALTNQGTVTWSNGSVSIGGSNSEITYLTNTGLFQITGDFGMNYGGGGRSLMYNAGTIRKLNSSGSTVITGFDLINLPSGIVDVLSGTLQFAAFQTNSLGGAFTATSPGLLKFSGNQTDSGGTASGSGQIQFSSGAFYFRTNTITNMKFVGGDVYVTGTTTFQQAGAITNITLDGANLRGTSRIAGTVTVNAGNLLDTVIVQPTGQLLLTSPAGSQLYSCNLINQGTVVWSSNSLSVGTTVISNGGTWTITGDAALNYGGGGAPYFTNSGTVQKIGGTGVSDFLGVTFVNMPSGIVTVTTGTLRLPNNYTNAAGELRLNGGTFGAYFTGIIGMTAGTLDGSGAIANPAIFDGGTVSPGPGAASIGFASSLALGTNAILLLDGTGTIPGVTYDRLSVTGAVAISNATLQVTSLPNVPVGTTFVIITNTTANPTTGTFNGLAENAQLTISGQPFRIHYSGGNGNDVVLVRDSGGVATGPDLSSGGYTNKTFRLLGVGGGSTIYSIQASTNLLQWTNVGLATGDISGNFIFIDTNATNFRSRFYRTTN
jgi:hypothetical protein